MRITLVGLATGGLATVGIVLALSSPASGQGGVPDYSLVQSIPLPALPDLMGGGDLTGDGLADVYCALKFPSSLDVFVNDGSGALVPSISIPLTKSVFGHGVGDFTGDAIPDLALGLMDLSGSRIQILPGNGSGAFLAPIADIATPINTGFLAVGDVNGDTALDVAITYIDLSTVDDHGVRIYLGDGLGQLTFSQDLLTSVPPYEVAIRDLDLDGVQDIVVSTFAFSIGLPITGTLDARMGQGGGVFAPPATILDQAFMGPMSVATLDGDALPDIAIQVQLQTGELELRVYRGLPAGGFQLHQTVPLALGTGVVQDADIDADGDPDLLVNQYDFMTGDIFAAYLPNSGTATFSPPVALDITGAYSAYSPFAAQLVPGGPAELVLGRTSGGNQLEVHAAPGGAPPDEFVRGDTNGDSSLNIADAVNLLNVLFVPGTPALGCDDAGDANDDEALNIADAIRILATLFVPGTPPIPAPAAACGADPTAGALGCATPPCP